MNSTPETAAPQFAAWFEAGTVANSHTPLTFVVAVGHSYKSAQAAGFDYLKANSIDWKGGYRLFTDALRGRRITVASADEVKARIAQNEAAWREYHAQQTR